MKTSNKILLTIGILATGCILFRSVILAIAVPQIANGHTSPFINLVGETSRIEIDPFTDLSIQSQGFVRISVKQGPKTVITGDKNLNDCVKIKYQGSTMLISYENKSSAIGYLNIVSPSVKSINISNPDVADRSYVAIIEGFNADSMDLVLTRFQQSLIRNCKFNKLGITARNTGMRNCDLEIEESNQIENLNMDIQGRGWMQLQSIGTKTNNFIVSDSIGISTSGQVLKTLKNQ
jgi:hypothetical protein